VTVRRVGRSSLTRPILEFLAAGVATLALVGFGASVLLARAATDHQKREAEAQAQVLVRGPLAASVSDGVVTGEPGAVALLDSEVRKEVLGQLVVGVKLRLPSGRYVYSSDPGLPGTAAAEADLQPLLDGKVTADVTALTEADDAPERALHQQLFQVYSIVHTPLGQPLILETYVRSSGATPSRSLFIESIPARVGGLIVLEAMQVPLALSLARRVQHAEDRQEQLLEHAVAASDAERRRIVGDLHDGVVQELAGLNFSLTRVADRVDATGDEDAAKILREAASTTRRNIQALRSLLVDIYPANLREEGLFTALSDLAAGTMSQAKTDVFVDPALELTPTTEALVYRAAQEAVRNAARHSGARTLAVTVAREGDDVVLSVVDDGCGFDAAGRLAKEPANGHLGLRLLAELASGADGQLEVDSAPGKGTHLRFAVRA
jgi:two-component system, NarL family, sensor kinase